MRITCFTAPITLLSAIFILKGCVLIEKPLSPAPVIEKSVSIYDYEKPREWQTQASKASARSAQVYAMPLEPAIVSVPPPDEAPIKQISTPPVAAQRTFITTTIKNIEPKTKPTPVAALAPAAKAENTATGGSARITQLRAKYVAGDIKAAHQLALELINTGQSEEADMILDYAARNGNKESMRLYGNRIKAMGDLDRGNYWLKKSE